MMYQQWLHTKSRRIRGQYTYRRHTTTRYGAEGALAEFFFLLLMIKQTESSVHAPLRQTGSRRQVVPEKRKKKTDHNLLRKWGVWI